MDHNLIAFPVTPKRRDADPEPDRPQRTRSPRNILIAGIVLGAGLLAGVGGWLLLTAMSPDVRDTANKSFNGDRASVGAELSLIVQEMNDLSVRKARLLAERDEAETIRLSNAEEQQLSADGGLLLLKGQDALLRNRRQARLHQRALLRQHIAAIHDEISAMKRQEQGIKRQLKLTMREDRHDREPGQLVGFEITVPQERNAAKLQASHGQIVADIARAHGRITAVEMQILRLEMRFRDAVLSELVVVRKQLATLSRQRIAAEDRLRRGWPDHQIRDSQRTLMEGAH